MDKYSTLWRGASIQDSLLQAYRQFNILLQGFLFMVASGFSIATLAFGNVPEGWLTYSIAMAISALGVYMLLALNKLIKARSADVNYFHRQIIEFEKSLPKEEQVLTAFKVYQKFGREEANPQEHFLNFSLEDPIRNNLIEKEKGHTRKILDRDLFWGILLGWVFLHLVVIVGLFFS